MPVLGTDSLLAIRDYINDSNLIKVTYDKLVDLRDSFKLIPGTFYQITDYRTETKQPNTRSALHNFDVIVLSTSNCTLSEDAYATYHINEDGSGDDYFFHREVTEGEEKLISASWISPMPSIEDVKVLYTLITSEELYQGTGSIHDSAKIITELTTMENEDGIVVPAMLNPSPDDDTSMNCYYVYCGTFSINEWQNNLVSIQYEIYADSEEVLYDNESMKIEVICDAQYKDIDGVSKPVLYKTDVREYSPIDEVDYQEFFVYEDDYELDGVTYNRWIRYEIPQGGIVVEPSNYQILTQVIVANDEFIYSEEEIRNALEYAEHIYDKWQEYYPSDTHYGNMYHLTNHLVDAVIDVGPETITFEKIVNLDAWKLKYSLDNDESKFAWADNRAVMQVKDSNDEDEETTYLYVRDSSQDEEGQYAWIFISESGNKSIKDNTTWYLVKDTDIIYTSSEEVSIGDVLDMSGTPVTVIDYERSVGKGVIYRMIDDKNNDLPYDFKNIQYYKNSIWQYTFNTPSYEDDSLSNAGCHGNIIKNYLNKIKVVELNHNTFGNNCFNNTFGYGCYSNTFGYGCYYNTFGNNCFNNTFENGCYYNTFGNNCYYNTFGYDCYSNTFGNSCGTNTFGNYTSVNTFGNSCGENTFGNNCYYNTFGNGCFSNTFVNSLTSVTDFCEYNIIDNGCKYLYIVGNGTASSSNYLENIHIHQGVKGTYSEDRKTITVDRGLEYTTDVYPIGSTEMFI